MCVYKPSRWCNKSQSLVRQSYIERHESRQVRGLVNGNNRSLSLSVELRLLEEHIIEAKRPKKPTICKMLALHARWSWIILVEVLSYPRMLGLVIHYSFPVFLWSILRMFGKEHWSKELNNSSTKYTIVPGHVRWVCRIDVCHTTGFTREAESWSLRFWAKWAWNDTYTLDISPPKGCYPSLIKIYYKIPIPFW